VARCPHGIHASRFSSIQQSTHRLDEVELLARLVLTSVFCSLVIEAAVDLTKDSDALISFPFVRFSESNLSEVDTDDDELGCS